MKMDMKQVDVLPVVLCITIWIIMFAVLVQKTVLHANHLNYAQNVKMVMYKL